MERLGKGNGGVISRSYIEGDYRNLTANEGDN